MSILATELVFRILRDSDPRDIIRWRTVSKWFHAITCDPVLWRALYKKSPFPRPSGPFPTQSVASLERTLLKAAQLARSWTTRPMRAVSTTTSTVGSAFAPPKLISGRWFVICESCTRFVLHDLDPSRASKRTSQVFWQLENLTVGAWDVESVESVDGQCLVYLLCQLSDASWKLLEFRLNVDTGELYDAAVLDPPGSDLCTVALNAGNSHFLFIPAKPCGLVLDTRTHVFYKLPWVSNSMPVACTTGTIFTDTHLIIFIFLGSHYGRSVIHVFTPPPDGVPGENDHRVLCHTHRGQTNDSHLVHFKAMKPSIDPATGATNMRLIDYSTHREALQLVCVDLTLPKCSTTSTELLPITVEERRISIPRERVRLSRYVECFQYLDVSDDEHIRGFYRGKKQQKRKERFWDPIESQHILKFAIDTTQDPWAITRGPIAPAEWSEEVDPDVDHSGENIVFDGMRGKLCYRHDDQIMVVDIE